MRSSPVHMSMNSQVQVHWHEMLIGLDEFQSIWGQTSISHEMLLMSHAHVDEFLWPNEPKQVHAYVELARAHVGEI